MTSSTTIKLTETVTRADAPEVAAILKQELERLDGLSLPLQQGLNRSSFTDGKTFSVTILSVQRESEGLHAKAGIMYEGIIAGCSCADDPTPQSTINEYCELELIIQEDGNTTVKLSGGSQ